MSQEPRGPGRPRGLTKTAAIVEGQSLDDPRDPNAGIRPPRVPMAQGKNLEVYGHSMDNASFYYHWFYEDTNNPGKIASAEAAYYEHARQDSDGSMTVRQSGGGRQYLMRLPWEYRLQDLAEKRKKVALSLGAETSLKEGEYAPTRSSNEGGNSSVVDRSTSDNPYS